MPGGLQTAPIETQKTVYHEGTYPGKTQYREILNWWRSKMGIGGAEPAKQPGGCGNVAVRQFPFAVPVNS